MVKKKYFEDVADNEKLPSFQQTITRTHIVKYAGAGGDFNPMHHDEELAKAMGLPSVFAMGLMHGSMLARVITDWAGNGCVKRYKIKFTGMVWPHDVLTFSGSVTRKFRENDKNLVDCLLSVVNQKGEPAITGEATVMLPSKN